MSMRNSRVTRSQGFTMMELMIAVVILGVLASVALVGYQGYRDRAAMLVDETNQKVLQAAVKLYAYDHNALPASLSDLRPHDFQRAYALVVEGRKPYTLLAYLQESAGVTTAEAHVGAPGRLHPEYYQNNANITRCLSDTNGGVSYQISSAFSSASLSTLLDPANAGATLVFESDTGGNGADPSTATVSRHEGRRTSILTTVGGVRKRLRTTTALGNTLPSKTKKDKKNLSNPSSNF